jgi:hypothetical protein
MTSVWSVTYTEDEEQFVVLTPTGLRRAMDLAQEHRMNLDEQGEDLTLFPRDPMHWGKISVNPSVWEARDMPYGVYTITEYELTV